MNGQVGAQASGGSTQSTNATSAVMVLLNPNLIRIDASIDQTDIAKLKVGQQARITFDALTGTTYTALVSTVGLTPTTSSGVVTYAVSFALDTSRLASGTAIPSPGMSASITVTTESASNALVVPSRSVQGAGASSTVRLKTEDGEEATRVTTGLTNGTLTQITAGLEEGDEVAYTATTTTTTSSGTQQQQPGQFQGGGQIPGGGQFIPGGGGAPVAPGGGGVR